MQKYNASEILKAVVKELNITIPKLAESSGYGRPQAFYDVIKGKTKNISSSMANNITEAFPAISRDWLLKGKLPVLRDEIPDLDPLEHGMVEEYKEKYIKASSVTFKYLDKLEAAEEEIRQLKNKIQRLEELLKKERESHT